MSILIGRRSAKAGSFGAYSGPGASALAYTTPMWSLGRTPQKMALAAQELYRRHPWVRLAEQAVSSRAGGVAWHLETDDGELINDDSPPALVAIRDLLEKPQAATDLKRKMARREMWTLTSRHAGLCGTGFWYLDQSEALGGTPLAILYLNPARMYAAEDKAGNLLGWSLDRPIDEGGTPLEAEEVLSFYLDPPDFGHFGIGLVEAWGEKAALTRLGDAHVSGVLSAGGRLSGIVSPKDNATTITPEQWTQFVNDWRNIVESPQAAKRLQVARGPIDFMQTTANMDDLELVELMAMTRDDILTGWRVPGSQVGQKAPAGLNSGGTKSYDEAVLWQGAVHDRLETIRETIQFGLLDRYKAFNLTVELIIDEPEFDDDSPRYEKAQKALDQPLTVAERRTILGLEPFGDKIKTPEGGLLDELVLLPSGMVEAYVASVSLPVAPMPAGPGEGLPGIEGAAPESESTATHEALPETPPTPKPEANSPPVPGAPPAPLLDQVNAVGILIRSGFDPAGSLGAVGLPPIQHTGLQPVTVKAPGEPDAEAKAKLRQSMLKGLRTRIERKTLTPLEASTNRALAQQLEQVITRLRTVGIGHLRSKPGDTGAYWSSRQDAQLAAALTPHIERIATEASGGVVNVLTKAGPVKAAPIHLEDRVAEKVLDHGGNRIAGINETTRNAVREALAYTFKNEEATLNDAIEAVRGLAEFGESRAERIARTESAFAYNDAAVESYRELGVEKVEAIDGDFDEECAERNGQVFTVDEAAEIEDHPNGTLDWIPLIDDSSPIYPVEGGSGEDEIDPDALAEAGEELEATSEATEFDSHVEGVKWGDAEFAAWRESLAPEEVSALGSYYKSSTALNNAIRRNQVEDHKVQIAALDGAIVRNTIPKPIKVFRGLDSAYLPGNLTGGEVTDPGFMSTSLSRRTGEEFADQKDNPAYMEIRVPAGAHAAWEFFNDREAELIFPRGTKLKIISDVTDAEGIRHIVATL